MDSAEPEQLHPQPSNGELIHVFWHEGMLKHYTGNGVFDTGVDPGFLDVLEKHPENSDRIRNMVSILKRGPISPSISWHIGRPALIPELLSFHSQGIQNILMAIVSADLSSFLFINSLCFELFLDFCLLLGFCKFCFVCVLLCIKFAFLVCFFLFVFCCCCCILLSYMERLQIVDQLSVK